MGVRVPPHDVDTTFWNGRRVLVTGHTGFKGAWLSTWLSELGAEVTGFAKGVPTAPSLFELAGLGDEVHDVRGDVADGAALSAALRAARPDVVIHLAAQALVRASYRDPVETYRTNVMGSVQLLDAVRGCEDVQAVVMVTSDKCYDNREWPWAYREPERLGGHDPYSSSKAAVELVTDAYRSSFLAARGTGIATARAGNVIGGGDWSEDRLLPDVMRAALMDRPVTLRSPNAVRPWQHVLDCLSGYLVLAQRLVQDPAAAGGAWNFGPWQQDERTVRELVDSIDAAWPGGVDVQFDSRSQPHEAARLTLDSAKAREFLGWRPRWSADEAAARVVEWYLAYRDGNDVGAETRRQVHEHSRAGRS